MGLLKLLGIEKYLKKVKTYVDEQDNNINEKIDNIKVPAPDWNAQKGEAGYIENKPFKVNSNYVLDINSYHTIINDEDTPIYVYLETGCGQNTLVKCEKNSEEGAFDWYKFKVTKDKQYLPYYVESTGTFWESDDRIWSGSYIVNGDECPCTFIQTDSIERCANRIICDYTLEDGILQTIPDTYIPDTIARKEYVDEKVASIKPSLEGVNMTILKYLQNPYPIKLGETLPNDLLSIVINDEDEFIKANIMSLCVANIPDDTAGYDCYYAITGCVPDDAQITLSNGENWYYFDDEKCFRDYDA